MGYKSILRTLSGALLGEVALFGPDLEPSRLGILDDHVSCAPGSVLSRVTGDVGQAILVAQFKSNRVKDFIELVNLVGKKSLSPRALGNLLDLFLNLISCRLEDAEKATSRREVRVEKSDDIELNVAFLNLLDEFLVGILTVLVLSVGKNDDAFLRFFSLLDLIHRQKNRIVQSGTS